MKRLGLLTPDQTSRNSLILGDTWKHGVESLKSFGGSSPALRGMRSDLNIIMVRYFSYWHHRALSWTGSQAKRRQSPFSPMRTNGPFLLGLRMTRACQLRQWLFREPLRERSNQEGALKSKVRLAVLCKQLSVDIPEINLVSNNLHTWFTLVLTLSTVADA
jgi:hypothetical protein